MRDVLAAYVREHDPAPAVRTQDLPAEPDIDVTTALKVLARRPPDPPAAGALDLHKTRIPHTATPRANLLTADLSGADLTRIRGTSEVQIRKVARTDANTRF
ncbi:hypothetical protein [Actinomadura fibrosa]|uniref:Uncharacterized protein n=1 Tax=Actinomadura fibrosa TaxID=111802 RepID=A0ABW2XMI8_9ACTN|nr:hypothetical protein [Actinomadura fibrosa]